MQKEEPNFFPKLYLCFVSKRKIQLEISELKNFFNYFKKTKLVLIINKKRKTWKQKKKINEKPHEV